MILLLGVAVLYKYAGWIIFAIFCYFMMKEGIPRFVRWRRLQRGRRILDERAAREYDIQLERENREWLEAGLYEGQYPGATMPLTAPQEPLDWYDYPSNMPPDWSGIVRPR